MDLFAYTQIGDYGNLLEANGIIIPRLRGIRKMSEEKKADILEEDSELERIQFETYNKYVGRNDVLMVHARIGGGNWEYYGGPELVKEPWFIEKVDDAYDSTYCDIYVKIE